MGKTLRDIVLNLHPWIERGPQSSRCVHGVDACDICKTPTQAQLYFWRAGTAFGRICRAIPEEIFNA